MDRRAFLLGLALMAAEDDAKAAIRPSPLDAAFEAEDPAKAICDNPVFKRAIGEAVKARMARKADVNQNPKGLTPAQAARVRFIEALSEQP